MAQKIHFVQSPRCRCGSEQGNISWQFIPQEQPVSKDRAHTVHLPPSPCEGFPFLPQPGEFVCSEVALPTQSLLSVLLRLPLCRNPNPSKQDRQPWAAPGSKVIKGFAGLSESKMKWKPNMNICGKINARCAGGLKKA